MDLIRMQQVMKYGWKHAGQVAKDIDGDGKRYGKRCRVFVDIVTCYIKYKMWSNQYIKEGFWKLDKESRIKLGTEYKEKGIVRDEWQKNFRRNRKFFAKYGNVRYEIAHLRNKRNEAYTRQYHMGRNCFVGHSVEISRQHYLMGTIKIGNNVAIAKNVCIDYSGNVIIGDSVDIMDGVHIITHDHEFQHKAIEHNKSKNVTAGELEIEYGAAIGSKAIIMPSCHHIGKFARVGAGAVVTRDVPDYAVVLGVPAKVTRYLESASHSD